MRYFLHLGFDGGKYHGWQRQPNVISVQEAIENALQRILKEEIIAFGCGRTDTGVHASQYFMHFNVSKPFNFDLKFRLNKTLPADIAIYDIIEMDGNQHARYDAISRTYDYFIHLTKDPILINYSAFYEIENLDFESMQKASLLLMKYDDFRSICKQPDLYKHTICRISNVKLFVNENKNRLRFTITSDRFLQSMVRLCVYFLLEIGERKISLDAFENILANKLELKNKKAAFPQGLFLSKIEYPYLKLKQPEDLCSFLKMGLQ